MKTVLVFTFLLVAVALAETESEYKERMKQKVEECAHEQDISIEEVEKWKQHREHLSEDEKKKAGCLTACVMKKFNYMKDGMLDKEEMKKDTESVHSDNEEKKSKGLEAIESCSEKVKDESEECKKAHEFEKCLLEKIMPKHESE